MKILLLHLVFIFSWSVLFGQSTDEAAVFARQDLYTCPMHPEVISNKPGKCPKCGMDLVRKKMPKRQAPAKQAQPQKQPPKKVSPPAPVKKQAPAKTAPATKAKSPVQNPKVESKPVPKAGHQIEKPGLTYKPKKVRYDLYVNDTLVNFTGKKRKAVAINGSIPAPTLTFKQGDTAEIYVHNKMDVETSIHWHGVFLPNRFDGVPYLTQMPIKPHSTYLYKFPIIQNGTYWYHSHTALQEQSGMYGALIFNKTNEPRMPVIPIVLSDWTDMNPMEVNRSLHNATDWFAIRKGSTQSYAEAIKKGYLKTKLTNEWKRMTAMDVSDVYYERFLTNGKPVAEAPQFKAGDKVKLRIVNGGASSYFWLTYSGGKMTVVGNDGNDVQPIEVDRLIIAPAETYDIIVPIPEDMSYEFLATAEDRTQSTSLWLGSGMKMPAKPLGKLKYFEGMKMMNGMMKMNGDMEPMGMQMSNQQMDMNSVMYPEATGEEETGEGHEMHDMSKEEKDAKPETTGYMKGHEGHQMPQSDGHAGHDMNLADSSDIVTLNYGMLRATEKTTLKEGPWRELRFELTGNMNRYVWTIDNKTVGE